MKTTTFPRDFIDFKYNCKIALVKHEFLFKFAAHSGVSNDFHSERWQSGRMHWSWKPAYREVPGVRIPLSPHTQGTKLYQNAQNQRFGHFFCPNGCTKMHQNVPPLGGLAGWLFRNPKKSTQQCYKMVHNGTDGQSVTGRFFRLSLPPLKWKWRA